jgi:hypothetical protein
VRALGRSWSVRVQNGAVTVDAVELETLS